MLLELFANIHAWVTERGRPRRDMWLGFAIGLVLVLIGAAFGLVWEPAAILFGGLGGVAWLVAAHIAWWFVIPERWRERTNFRARMTLSQRRTFAFVVGGFWLLTVATVGMVSSPVTGVLLGATNVVVLVSLAHVAVADPEERAVWDAEQEAALAARMRERAMKKANGRRRKSDVEDVVYEETDVYVYDDGPFDEDALIRDLQNATVPEPGPTGADDDSDWYTDDEDASVSPADRS